MIHVCSKNNIGFYTELLFSFHTEFLFFDQETFSTVMVTRKLHFSWGPDGLTPINVLYNITVVTNFMYLNVTTITIVSGYVHLKTVNILKKEKKTDKNR